MHKTKKKSKTAKIPKPIKVKKEKSDEDRLPQPMTHYLDDRLEMVKQIFNTLKPKTIVNLAPDFLKTQALEEIEEACLNELLCISTKRLKSIITDTQCPTDTESSDNDSDVERHEEHISLEEISSDSEIEGTNSKKARRKKTSKVGETTDVSKTKKDKSTDDNQGDGQISVLELLELQARARAIRSQLALEPVTKIEVDSDEEKRNEKDKNITSKRNDKANKNERKRFSNERESRDSAKLSRTSGSTENLNSKSHKEKEVEKISSKKITLKRTYRNHNNKEQEDDNQEKQSSETTQEPKDKSEKVKSKEISKEQEKCKTKKTTIIHIKKEKRSRSPSPDVIPIVAEPETLFIADSSDDEKISAKKNEGLKATSEIANNEQETPTVCKSSEEESQNVNGGKDNSTTEATKKSPDILQHAEESGCAESSTKKPQSSELKRSNKEKSKSNDVSNSANHSDDDRNDDVISLGGDLENEMDEQLENEVNAMQSPHNTKPIEDSSQDNNKSQEESLPEDVISLESSDDERARDNQSWHSRYMKSSKVSKVLAASRLGKRVRDKIKKSKHSKKETQQENLEGEKESAPAFTSKHEDGSVEQYKELLEMRQRKSS